VDYIDDIREQHDWPGVYRKRVVLWIVEQMKKRADVHIPESTAYLCIRLYQKCARINLPGLSRLSLLAATKLASVEDERLRLRLARKALRDDWSARRIGQAVLEARGYGRPLAEPEDSTSKLRLSPRESRRPWQPVRQPRVALRELVKLTRRSVRASEAWLWAEDDGQPVFEAFRKLTSDTLADNGRPVVTKEDLATLKSMLTAFHRAATELAGHLTAIDDRLAKAEK
jgi:hypothetical protein